MGLVLGGGQEAARERPLHIRAIVVLLALLAAILASEIAYVWGVRLMLEGAESSWPSLEHVSGQLSAGTFEWLGPAFRLAPCAALAVLRSGPGPERPTAHAHFAVTGCALLLPELNHVVARALSSQPFASPLWAVVPRLACAQLAYTAGLLLGDQLMDRWRGGGRR